MGSLAACQGTLPPPEPPPAPAETRQLPQAELLLFPVSDGESLLGRSVQMTKDGAWTMSDARAPGCDVEVLREKSGVKQTRRVDVSSVTTLSAGFASLIAVNAKLGHATHADLDIETVEVLRGRLRGPCGERVVDTVFVGTGRRTLLSSASRAGSVSAAIPVAGAAVTPSVGSDAKLEVLDTTSWTTPQAWGFATTQLATVEPLDIEVDLPSFLNDGDKVSLAVKTTKKAYIVIYYLDAEGQGDVLWPSNEELAPAAEPGRPAMLPSEAETRAGIAIRARLTRDPAKASRETLVLYAFSERADFDRLKPQVGGSHKDGAAYAADLTQKLAAIAPHRWSRFVATYTILPRQQ